MTTRDTTVDLATEIVAVSALISAATESLENLKKKRAAIEERLLDQFAETGVNSIRVANKAVGIRRDVYAKILDTESLHAALTSAGYADIIKPKVDSSTLSALVREFERGDTPWPDALEGVVVASEKYSIRVTAR